MIINNLGLAHLEQGHTTEAGGYYEQARQLFAAVSDPHGENTARANLAWLAFADERYVDFLDEMQPVLTFYRKAHADRNAAITLRGIGLAEAELGRTSEAVADLRVALEAFERLDLRLDSTMTWNGLGEIHQRAGDNAAATDAFTEALTASERSGSAYERARSHQRLGELARAANDQSAAREHWSAALADYRRLGAPQAATVQEALDALTEY